MNGIWGKSIHTKGGIKADRPKGKRPSLGVERLTNLELLLLLQYPEG